MALVLSCMEDINLAISFNSGLLEIMDDHAINWAIYSRWNWQRFREKFPATPLITSGLSWDHYFAVLHHYALLLQIPGIGHRLRTRCLFPCLWLWHSSCGDLEQTQSFSVLFYPSFLRRLRKKCQEALDRCGAWEPQERQYRRYSPHLWPFHKAAKNQRTKYLGECLKFRGDKPCHSLILQKCETSVIGTRKYRRNQS